MDKQIAEQVEQRLRSQWDQLYPAILERFTTVSKADIDAAVGPEDLVRRVSDLTRHSTQYVEQTITELAFQGQGQSAFSGASSSMQSSQSSQGSQSTPRPLGGSR